MSPIEEIGIRILFFEGSFSDDGKSRVMSTGFNDVDADPFTHTAYMDKGDGKLKNRLIIYTRQ